MISIALAIVLMVKQTCVTSEGQISQHNYLAASLDQPSQPKETLPPWPNKCNFPQLMDVQERIGNARYPRIGQAWSRADNLAEDRETTIARHGLYFNSAESFGLRWKQTAAGESSELEPDSVEEGKAKRSRLLLQNPNLVMLAEIRYHDAKASVFPPSSPYWQHEAGSTVAVRDYPQFDKLDYTNPLLQDHVAAQARAALQSGVVDGIMLDWWQEGSNQSDNKAKLDLLNKVRTALGPDALIMINTNHNRMSQETTDLVNGYYMECYKTKETHSEKDAGEVWQEIEETLDYAEKNCRPPHINMVETWWEDGSTSKRAALDKMRATTTLVMTHSDAYALFADPDRNGETEDHQHNWYSFWDADVGKPLATGSAYPDGSYRREFEHATVVSNATANKPVIVSFSQDRTRASDATILKAGEQCTVNAHDGEIFLK